MALIPLLFISISDSLVILVFLCVPEFKKNKKKKDEWCPSQPSPTQAPVSYYPKSTDPPSISVLGTVEKHVRVYQRKCFPVLGNDDKQTLGQRQQWHDAS